MAAASLASIMRDQIALSVTCLDRLYLNGYVPSLQAPGQLVRFCRQHLGQPIASPALFRPLHDRFVQAVKTFAQQQDVPLIQFKRGQRKDTIAAWYRARFKANEGVVFIGVAQEKATSFKARKVVGDGSRVSFDFSRQSVVVNHVYFYVHDAEWGPAFIKVGTYLPYPARVCLNGHHWAQQQLRRAGIDFEALDNGFRWCENPTRLQALCDTLGPGDVQAFFDRWLDRLPWPLTPADRHAGYRHRLSLWQVEVSLTQIFREPIHGRRLFEAMLRENLDLGRPDRVSLLFPTRYTRATPPPKRGYRTRVITAGVAPSLHVTFKHTDLKQYFKEGCGLRTEATFNDPTDVQPTKALETLPHLREVGCRINERLLETQRLSLGVTCSTPLIEQIQRPVAMATRRVPGLRLSEPRVLALLQALCAFSHIPLGFRHRELRPQVAQLLGWNLSRYSPGAMTYDLRRLRLHGLIERVPRTFRYIVTPAGLQLAFAVSRIYLRLLQPEWSALLAPTADLPKPLHHALLQLDTALQLLAPPSNPNTPPTADSLKLDSSATLPPRSGG
jgi:hypothetical protein